MKQANDKTGGVFASSGSVTVKLSSHVLFWCFHAHRLATVVLLTAAALAACELERARRHMRRGGDRTVKPAEPGMCADCHARRDASAASKAKYANVLLLSVKHVKVSLSQGRGIVLAALPHLYAEEPEKKELFA